MKLTLHKRWCVQAEQGLSKVLREDRAGIVEGVNAGRLQLWEVNDGALWMVTCVEKDSRELIVCCMQGRGMKAAAAVLWRTMQLQGLRGARWFTERPALARALRRYPVKLLGYVYRVEAPAHVAQ